MSVIKIIPNTNDNYLVSDEGAVFTRPRQGNKGGELSQRLNGNGYPCVELRIDGKKIKCLVHRLVALTFLDNPENKPCVNHKDGNKLNNSVENLEWCTYSENMKHAIATGLNVIPTLNGENHPMRKLNSDNVKQIRSLYGEGISCAIIAKDFHITKRQVYNIVNDKHWKPPAVFDDLQP